VGGNIKGGNITSEGVTLVKSGFFSGISANNVLIKGSLIAGTNDTSTSTAVMNGSLVITSSTGKMTVLGGLTGNLGAGGKINYVSLNAGGTQNGPSTNITINGSVAYSRISNGLMDSDNFKGGDPTVSKSGSITIGGDFISSSISIGIGTGADGFLGTADDDLPKEFQPGYGSYARIASIIIKGNASATPGSGDSSVIQSEQIDQLIVKGTKIPLTKGKSNDNSTFSGINIRELTRAVAT
jgi:hypothetical protein